LAIKVILRKEELEVTTPGTVGEVLKSLGLPPESYLVLRGGLLIDENEPLHDGDTLQLIGVISGG
jgi:sulfur carrier protein ThiS